MQFNSTILAAIHNTDTTYYVNVEHDDGSKTYVAPGSSVQVSNGWAYIRACQEAGGTTFVYPPGLLQWPAYYGDVSGHPYGLYSGTCQWGVDAYDPNDCPSGYQHLPNGQISIGLPRPSSPTPV
ncbi:uncharacterized protein N7458_001026 [Penicillium daleae]|uniref:Uncharacterized protein n=1 Tax=Penicillium daleae TaxID=63821 RepID=A0AAD6G8E0_9EURO|nr:uncharacterized protein N7458_001026 [Penicillium daleae]KAJ5465340.1 hypothetical protein N7458_001026 [Penicillium daleae]